MDYDGTRKRKRVIYITCGICTDEKPETLFFTIKRCNHVYCYECITKYVSSKLQEKDHTEIIGCPSVGCHGRLDIDDCRQILPREIFQRWSAAMIPPSERLYCPYEDCSAYVPVDVGDGGGGWVFSSGQHRFRVACPKCSRMVCSTCRVPWHSGITCRDFARDGWEENDSKLVALAEKNQWRRCPQCGIFVDKDGASCHFITCRCGSHFCYACGKKTIRRKCTCVASIAKYTLQFS